MNAWFVNKYNGCSALSNRMLFGLRGFGLRVAGFGLRGDRRTHANLPATVILKKKTEQKENTKKRTEEQQNVEYRMSKEGY